MSMSMLSPDSITVSFAISVLTTGSQLLLSFDDGVTSVFSIVGGFSSSKATCLAALSTFGSMLISFSVASFKFSCASFDS